MGFNLIEGAMILYHVTTEKKAKAYRQSGEIHSPVRGFDTLLAAMCWAMRTGRKVIYEVTDVECHLLPDHSNKFGRGWWTDTRVTLDKIKCVVSPES